jgi:hypothetical protein
VCRGRIVGLRVVGHNAFATGGSVLLGLAVVGGTVGSFGKVVGVGTGLWTKTEHEPGSNSNEPGSAEQLPPALTTVKLNIPEAGPDGIAATAIL